ncbi:MAG: alpha/beta fold hydrolase [Caulobacteraceae bacterium]|nr:alpha/beta fold hydrolase [Caulobacteraceae bacterium]
MRKALALFLIGWLLVLAGSWAAHAVQTAGGVEVRDVRFAGAGGTTMSGLLYVPKTATRQTPAPGILAVHGYINSRETQSGFAIEFARRGYVVLALDQTGHGYSGGAAFSNGFGGPDGLTWLRSLPMVDRANIGLEGHSMGGWTVLAAATAQPEGYRSMVLEGSATGAPFAAEGTPAWPRNLAVVFSRYDEFSKLMWGVDRAQDVGASGKLQALFGTEAPVIAGQVYGDIGQGTARRLTMPVTTHPGDHLSTEAIGDSLDWFASTLEGGTPRPASDQIWYWKEAATGVALIGMVVLMLGTFGLLLQMPLLSGLKAEPVAGRDRRDGPWWGWLSITALLPVLTYFPAFILVTLALPPGPILRQGITNQIVVWALVNTALTLLLGLFERRAGATARTPLSHWLPALLLALATVGAGYVALALADQLLTVDFRFWVVAFKLPSADQAQLALIYLAPLTLFFLVAQNALHRTLTVQGDRAARQYATAIAAFAGGFLLMLAVDYGLFFLTGSLPTAFDPLSTVVAIQFVPLLAIVAIIAVFSWRRTGSALPGALVNGLLVTLYAVAGTATQVV